MYNNNRGIQIDTRSVVFNLIAINVFVFGVTSLLPGIFPSTAFDMVISPAEMFLGVHYPSSAYFHPFQLVSHMFVHFGFMHILFNMICLYIFGNMLEQFVGPRRFLELYLLAGLGGAALDIGLKALQVYNLCGYFAPPAHIVNASGQLFGIINGTSAGASGAIYGVQVAFAMLFPNTEMMMMFIPIPIKAKYLIGGLLFSEVVFGFANSPHDQVGHFAHIGGALTGFIIVSIWNRGRKSLY